MVRLASFGSIIDLFDCYQNFSMMRTSNTSCFLVIVWKLFSCTLVYNTTKNYVSYQLISLIAYLLNYAMILEITENRQIWAARVEGFDPCFKVTCQKHNILGSRLQELHFLSSDIKICVPVKRNNKQTLLYKHWITLLLQQYKWTTEYLTSVTNGGSWLMVPRLTWRRTLVVNILP